MRKTKIVCTLGPATDNEKVLKKLMLAGMDVARLNMSHQEREEQKVRADAVKKIRKELSLPIALLLDTKGPEIRIGKFSTSKIDLKLNQKFCLLMDDVVGDETKVSVSYKDLYKDVKPGVKILIDDGLVELEVKNCSEKVIECTVLNPGTLSANKSINIPEISLSLPFINPKDKKDIKFAVQEDFDFIAASFTRSADDIRLLKKELCKNNGDHIKIIAKIENSEGIKNIDEILTVSDGIMVARGDLGVEVPIEDIPIIQKKLVKKACATGKYVIIATQMLDSMVSHPRPTRAECTDVANAIYDGTGAIMLSAETAAGKYPVQAVKTMATIAERTEQDVDYKKKFSEMDLPVKATVTSAISHSTCATAHELDATCIITVSKSGRTAEVISKYKPACPILAGTTSKTVMRQMNLLFGVTPLLMKEKKGIDELFDHIVSAVYDKGYVKKGDLAILTAGIPFGVSGTTNLLKVQLIGNVLVSGTGINKYHACANLCVCQNEQEAKKNFIPGDILVIPETSDKISKLLKEAAGIITESDGLDSHAAIAANNLCKPTIVGAKNATKLLKSGTTVTLDAAEGIVFSNVGFA